MHQCLCGIVPNVDPLVLVANAITAVVVLFLLAANQNDVRLDFIVACDSGTEVSPLSINLNCLYNVNFG
jgi:hypothetical protein